MPRHPVGSQLPDRRHVTRAALRRSPVPIRGWSSRADFVLNRHGQRLCAPGASATSRPLSPRLPAPQSSRHLPLSTPRDPLRKPSSACGKPMGGDSSDATPASKALPPYRRTPNAAAVVSGCPVETPLVGPITAGRSAEPEGWRSWRGTCALPSDGSAAASRRVRAMRVVVMRRGWRSAGGRVKRPRGLRARSRYSWVVELAGPTGPRWWSSQLRISSMSSSRSGGMCPPSSLACRFSLSGAPRRSNNGFCETS